MIRYPAGTGYGPGHLRQISWECLLLWAAFPETDIHGRLMAGTLDSQSSCPGKARFIASMMDDTWRDG